MNNTEQTKKDIDTWQSGEEQNQRYLKLKEIATDAGIIEEFEKLPTLHIHNLSYDQYWMNVLAMAKIRELRRIAVLDNIPDILQRNPKYQEPFEFVGDQS